MLWSQRFGTVTRLLLFQEEEGGNLKKSYRNPWVKNPGSVQGAPAGYRSSRNQNQKPGRIAFAHLMMRCM